MLVNCAVCNKVLDRRIKKSIYKVFFCCGAHQHLAHRTENYFGYKPKHYKNGKCSYKKVAFRNYEQKCEICGYDEYIKILEVHHIDDNRKNNSLSNLIILCPICHTKITRKVFILIDRKLINQSHIV